VQAESFGIVRQSSRRLRTFVAQDERIVEEAQSLRYRVFSQEMGARLHSNVPGLDVDEIDGYCDHLVVYDRQAEKVIGCTRLLSDAQAAKLGHFYSEGEFHLDGVLALPGRFLEIGRTCVDSNYRGGMVIAALWSGLADYIAANRFDYLMGCASISPGPSGFAVEAVYRQLPREHLGPDALRVAPKRAVPPARRCQRDESGIPPLLQAYLRLGAWVCGEPCWDEDFNVMDLFVLLPVERLAARYEKHFIGTREHRRETIPSIL
jgi:putative hemolysin